MAASTPIPTRSGEPPEAFRPDKAQLPTLLDALCSPSLSVQQIATQFRTSIEALSLYITSPRGDDSLANLDSALAIRLRLVALSALPAAVASLSAIVQEHARQECDRHKDCDAAPLTLNDINLQERKRVNARKASAMLFRLATLHPRTHTRTQPTPSGKPASPTPDHSAAHFHRAATASTTPSVPDAASDIRTTIRAASIAERLEPLDPLDRIDSLSDFSIPRELRAQTPRTASDFSGACDDHPRPSLLNASQDGRGSFELTASLTKTIASKPAMTVAHRASAVEPPRVPPVRRLCGATGARSLVERAGSTTPINVAALNGSTHPVSCGEPPLPRSSVPVRRSTTAAQSDHASSPCSPTGCSPVAGGGAAPRGAHPREAVPNHRTLKGSALQTNALASLRSGP